MSDPKFKVLKLNTFKDERGSLTPIELDEYIDWPVKRVYYVTDVKGVRGGHAVRGEKKIYVMMNGTCRAKFHDGDKWEEIELNGPSDAILMTGMCYREFDKFSEGSVLAAISSVKYDPEAYIYDLDDFIKEVKDAN